VRVVRAGASLIALTASAILFTGVRAAGLPANAVSAVGEAAGGAARPLAVYALPDLQLLRETMKYVQEGYVEPARVDSDRMFSAALEAVEAAVPAVMFRRDQGQLNVRIGAWRGVLPAGRVDRADGLAEALTPVAELLQAHLSASDLQAAGIGPRADDLVMIEIAMVNGALETLDPHSMLLPPEAAREMDTENLGESGGLGINVVMEDGWLKVEYPMPGSPAARAGVREGDVLRRIDRQPVQNLPMDEAVELLRGPVGKVVELEVLRGAERVVIPVERERISLAPVEAFGLGSGLGYVRIRTFHSTVAAELADAITALTRQEATGPSLRGLVLDLRDNPGGYLNQAIGVADLFLAEGDIVSTVGPRDLRPRVESAIGPGTLTEVPIVVLIDANSASASEIVAGALRNQERAVIVGERSFGKGSVQNLHSVPFDSKLKLTVAQYLTPGDRSIQSVGIPADIELLPAQIGRTLTTGSPVVSLFGRERLKREADLSEHLDAAQVAWGAPAWMMRYPRALTWEDRRPYERPQAGTDPELRLAMALLMVAPGPRRPEMLEAGARLVAREAGALDASLAAAMGKLGLDWRDGPDPVSATVDLTWSSDGPLVAGASAAVTVSVTNRGAAALHRAVVVIEGHEVLGGLELPLGYVPAGGSASFTSAVFIPAGYPSERTPITASLRGAGGGVLALETAAVETAARPAPRLAWSWRVEEPLDGVIDIGDDVSVVLEVQNVGEGPAEATTARLRNGSGRAVDLVVGTLEVGATSPRPGCLGRCKAVLLPGETWQGTFKVEVIDPMDNGYALELVLADEEAWDFGAAARGGGEALYSHHEDITFSLGAPPPASARHEPPRIELSRTPPLSGTSALVSISGRVTDDAGLRHVMVFAGDDKVGFEDATGLRSVPFAADAWLSPGLTTLTIIATDADGHVTATSRGVYLSDDALRAERR
jgi:carboxyl-terminal processing protease